MTRILRGLAATILVWAIAGSTLAQPREALYQQRDTLVRVILDGSDLRIFIEDPGRDRREGGARPGDLLFSGTVVEGYADGMAWLFHARCGPIDHYVYGAVRIGQPFTLTGAAPVFGDRDCRIVDNVHEGRDAVLAFTPAAGAVSAPALRDVTALPRGGALCVTNVRTTLNLRVGPGTGHPIVAELAAELCGVTLIGPCRTRWCPVEAGDAMGWASADYLRAAVAR